MNNKSNEEVTYNFIETVTVKAKLIWKEEITHNSLTFNIDYSCNNHAVNFSVSIIS